MWKSPIIVSITILVLMIPGLIGCGNKNESAEKKTKVISKKIESEVKKNTSQEKKELSVNPDKEQLENTIDTSADNDNLKIAEKDVHGDQPGNVIQDGKIALVGNDKNGSSEEGVDEAKKAAEIEISENNPDSENFAIDKADEDKRKAAELLASIHHEVSSIESEEKNGLNALANPFLPLFNDAPDPPAAKNPSDRKPMEKTPITVVDLSQLKLVATMRANSGNKALVEDSTGKGYVIDKGTPIGLNFGKVVEITDDSVVVDEEIETLTGDIKIQRREIKLQKAPGE